MDTWSSFPWGRFSEYFEVVSLEIYNKKVFLLLYSFFTSLPFSSQVRTKPPSRIKPQRDGPSCNSMNRQDVCSVSADWCNSLARITFSEYFSWRTEPHHHLLLGLRRPQTNICATYRTSQQPNSHSLSHDVFTAKLKQMG